MNRIRLLTCLMLGGLCWACHATSDSVETVVSPPKVAPQATRLIVLGNVQDAGYPQMGCMKACCKDQWHDPALRKMVTCLGLIEGKSQQTWLFEATPDIKYQSQRLSQAAGHAGFVMPKGIFLTHGHIGHYIGLMHLGREVMNETEVPVYAMPRMKQYLERNGPWGLLVNLKNIKVQGMQADASIRLSDQLAVTPVLVPHRGEYSETVGFRIQGPHKTALFIPDIDKWHLWERSIKEEIRQVDLAFLDATFYQNGEVGNRDMSEIPHPFVEESMTLFADLPQAEKAKIHFIHMNHTNPLLQADSPERTDVIAAGYQVAQEGKQFEL